MAERDIHVEFEWHEEPDLALLARALLEHVRLGQNQAGHEEIDDAPEQEAA